MFTRPLQFGYEILTAFILYTIDSSSFTVLNFKKAVSVLIRIRIRKNFIFYSRMCSCVYLQVSDLDRLKINWRRFPIQRRWSFIVNINQV